MQQSSKLADIRAFAALAATGSFAAAGKQLGRDPTVVSRSVQALEARLLRGIRFSQMRAQQRFARTASTAVFARMHDSIARRQQRVVSRSVQALEARLGVRLAERTTRVVTLTEAGAVYASRVRSVLHELDTAEQEAAAFGQGEPQGHLRVALPGSFARLWMGPLLTGFLQAHPRVTLEAHYSNLMVDLVGQGYDLAVRLAELSDTRLIARKVAGRRRLLCASPAYLARKPALFQPQDIHEHDCLCYTGRDAPFQWVFQSPSGERQSVTVRARIASDDADLLVEAAAAGLGLFYTTDWHVGPLLRDGRLVEVMTDWPVVDRGGIYVLTTATARVPSKTRGLSDWIAQGLAKPPWR